jgi:hypothetical protein
MLAKPVMIKSSEAPFTPRASNSLETSNEFQRVEKFLSYWDQTPSENIPVLFLTKLLELVCINMDIEINKKILTTAQQKE